MNSLVLSQVQSKIQSLASISDNLKKLSNDIQNRKFSTPTEIVCLIDNSASMRGLVKDTVNGFNEFLSSQKDGCGQANLTVKLFNNRLIDLHSTANIEDVSELNYRDIVPEGGTALYDAIGLSIASMEKRANNSKVVFCIITDGEDMDSREYSLKTIKEIILDKRQHGWEFVFLSSDIGCGNVDLGVRNDLNSNFENSSRGIKDSFKKVDEMIKAFRETGTIPENRRLANK